MRASPVLLRAALVSLLSLGAAGCAGGELTPAGARVAIDRTPRAGCRLVSTTRGSAGYNGRSGEENAAAVERWLRNQAAERGGNALVITERHLGGGESADTLSTPRGASSSGGCPNCISMSASVYACPEVPASAATATVTVTPATGEKGPPFAEKAAEAALSAAAESAARCATKDGPAGEARVRVTFASTGDVVYVEVEGDGLAGSAAGECVARKFRNARVPAFTGEARSLVKSVRLVPLP